MRNDNVKMDNTINIVFAADSNYAQHATVAMISIIRHTKSQERLRFFVLADNIPKTTKEKMKLSVIDKCADIVFVDIDATKISKYYVSGQLSRTAYARLEMAKWLPADIDKVIYLDCDLIVFSDIVELWDYDLEDKPVYIWAPNRNYEIIYKNGYYDFNIDSTNYETYTYMQYVNSTSFKETKLTNVKDVINASYSSKSSSGDKKIFEIKS